MAAAALRPTGNSAPSEDGLPLEGALIAATGVLALAVALTRRTLSYAVLAALNAGVLLFALLVPVLRPGVPRAGIVLLALGMVGWTVLAVTGRPKRVATYLGFFPAHREWSFDRELTDVIRELNSSLGQRANARSGVACPNEHQEEPELNAIRRLRTLAPPTVEWGELRDRLVEVYAEELSSRRHGREREDDWARRKRAIEARRELLRRAYRSKEAG